MAPDIIIYTKEYEKRAVVEFPAILCSLATMAFGREKIVNPNLFYQDESCEEFISRMIAAKEKKVERVLDVY